MESLSEQTWDAVICGTGLPQSLLALALSRSNKRILHLDANDYYGENEAAFSLQEADAWSRTHAGADITQQSDESTSVPLNDGLKPPLRQGDIFRNATVWKHANAEAEGLSFSRAYSLALAPQIIHTKSKLLSQLVSSKAYRQVEFLAVGSFFVYSTADEPGGVLARIPSSREDVFSAQTIPSRSKRTLMKFLKFVIDYDSDEQKPIWEDQADKPLSAFLVDEFKLDDNLRNYIMALTLTLDRKVTVKSGLAAIHRHLTSLGLFGPGFCAVYPKWGGLSEIAQVGCRAGAVGGGIYMLSTKMSMDEHSDNKEISLSLANDVSIRTTALISAQQTSAADSQTIARLVAIINSPLRSLFETLADGAPVPALAIVAFPSGSLTNTESGLDLPAYAFVHSSDTGECPTGQCVVYLTMVATPRSAHVLDAALAALLQTVTTTPSAECLYKLYYEQTTSSRQPLVTSRGSATVLEFPSPSLGLAFDDASLDAVEEAWKLIMKPDDTSDNAYMMFAAREDMGDDDSVYD
ncbi:GDP dissociation inhibitor [Xylaria sp. CBS 124048]|nr:GDP dissociation inhibitor [Xylaria sp. CBS 124048]